MSAMGVLSTSWRPARPASLCGRSPAVRQRLQIVASSSGRANADADTTTLSRRGAALLVAGGVLCPLVAAPMPARADGDQAGSKYVPMDALKGKDYGKSPTMYPDFTATPSGLQYKDIKEGSGPLPRPGDGLVLDWGGYTIGYYGRPFEARNKPKGSAFTDDKKEYLRVRLGAGQVIPGLEEALAGMRAGGIRRVIVPEELGYPGNDFRKVGPKPSTFSGERALDFVLKNQGMVDKTLLFDVELIRIDRQ